MKQTSPTPEREARSTNVSDIELEFTEEKDQINPDTFALLLLSLNTFYKVADRVLRNISPDEYAANQDALLEKIRQRIQIDYSSEGRLTFDTDSKGFEIVSLVYGSKLKLGLRGKAAALLAALTLTGGQVKTPNGTEVTITGILPALRQSQEVVSPGRGQEKRRESPGKIYFAPKEGEAGTESASKT
jgi:hypothetical protein